jgi:hypothetical protein
MNKMFAGTTVCKRCPHRTGLLVHEIEWLQNRIFCETVGFVWPGVCDVSLVGHFSRTQFAASTAGWRVKHSLRLWRTLASKNKI